MGMDFIPTGVATGVSGSIFAKSVTTTLLPGAANALVISAGLYYLYGMGANVQLQVQDENGTWQNVGAAGTGAMFGSDGTNVRVINNGGGNQNFTTIKVG